MKNRLITFVTKAALRAIIKGQWVTFTGWLFYYSIHADEAENTAPRSEKELAQDSMGDSSRF
ncbi:MAG: hypothetical protein M3410_08185 [Acidobacteriota bacterium]|nr:hypothetical protein [Acidobacteriota bacterium]